MRYLQAQDDVRLVGFAQVALQRGVHVLPCCVCEGARLLEQRGRVRARRTWEGTPGSACRTNYNF